MNKIYLLGGNILNLGFLDVAARSNSKLVVVDWNEKISWLNNTHIKSDIKSPELLDKIDFTDVLFAYSSADVASYNVAAINKLAGLAAPEVFMIDNCVFKHKAYACFNSRNVLGRKYEFINDNDFAARVEKFYEYTKDFVVKPTNSSSSRGVSILLNTTLTELMTTIQRTLEEFPEGVMLDKFIGGTEYSIEMVVDADGNVRVWPIGLKGKSIHKTSEAVSVKVIYNPVLDLKFEADLINFAIECARSTGVRSSLLHLEVKCFNNELYPMEIACRSSGFVATHLCDFVSTESFLGTYADVLRGAKVVTGLAHKKECSSVYFFYDFPDGVVANLSNEDQLFHNSKFQTKFANLPSLQQGDLIGKHINDETKKAYQVLICPRHPKLQDDLETMEAEYYAKIIGELENV